MRRLLLAAVVVAVALAGAAEAGRPDTFELRGKAGPLGRLPAVILDDAGTYVSAERLAAVLKGSWSVKGSRGTLAVGQRTAHFIKNRPHAVVQGQMLELEAPVRAGASGWLLPADFLSAGLGRLTPWLTVTTAASPQRPPAPRATAVSVDFEELRYRSYPSFTRIVVETGGMPAYAVAATSKEIRVRLPRLRLVRARAEAIADGLVREIRLEPVGADAVLSIPLEGPVGEVKEFILQDPFRLVLDIYRPKDGTGAPDAARALEPLRLIVLDAGHGGHDPGAVGPSGLHEKEVVLDVTRRVARMAEEGLGVKVALTRSTDVFVPLRERTQFANRQRADLFVSIHANAHRRSAWQGVETYFLSSEASDSEARQVAAIENGVIQLESPNARPKGDLLKSILWDLAQSEFQQESSFLAETVLDSMTQSLGLVNRGVKQAGFYVLGGATMPAILVEIGFLSNRKEERKLALASYREAVARAIYAGLAEYKRRHDQRGRTVQTVPARAEPSR